MLHRVTSLLQIDKWHEQGALLQYGSVGEVTQGKEVMNGWLAWAEASLDWAA